MAVAPVKMSIFKPVYLDERVSLSPTEFTEAAGKIDEFLTGKLRKKLEGQCCVHGYVRPGSTQILARSMGTAEHGRFTGDFLYTCKVKVSCLLPYANQQLDCRVLLVNKLGCYALIVDEGRVREAMRILIPRDLHLGNADFDSLQVGKGIRVRLLRSRFQANDTFIQAVGMFEGFVPTADAKGEGKEDEAAAALQPGVPATEGLPSAVDAPVDMGPRIVIQEKLGAAAGGSGVVPGMAPIPEVTSALETDTGPGAFMAPSAAATAGGGAPTAANLAAAEAEAAAEVPAI